MAKVDLTIGSNHIRAQIGDIRFTSKLIDGNFPEYGRVIPASPTKLVDADRDGLRQALQRTAILSNEKYRGVRVSLSQISSRSRHTTRSRKKPRTRSRSTTRARSWRSASTSPTCWMRLAAIDTETVEIGLTDANSSCLIRASGTTNVQYVVMPMRL